jgi:ADP-ribosylglycohydrolase
MKVRFKLKAWELSKKLITEAKPILQSKEDLVWTEDKVDLGNLEIQEQRDRWYTHVPGSRAPDMVLIGAVQATENKGYDVTEAEKLIPVIQAAYDAKDNVNFLKLVAKLYHLLGTAPKNEQHSYWSFNYYNNFEDVTKEVAFPPRKVVNLSDQQLFDKLHAGWLAQIAGAAIGTILEGYTADNIKEAFGEVRDYLREPSTFNDDILFELAFLETILAKGKEVTSEDIGLEWVGRIIYFWTAEEVAYKNLKRGIMPPMSAELNNPWNEWIGAQMRGSVCGLVAPGNPELAARLAWIDGTVSHINNGVLGEMFNAILTSLSFTETDVRELLKKTIELMPQKSEYYSVIEFAYNACRTNETWLGAWKLCEKQFERYNWIHTYPNAAAQVVALYYGGNSFDECMYVIAMCGQDVDCNAGQIGTVYGIMFGKEAIDKKWTDPFNDQFESLCRGYEKTTISAIARRTLEALKKLNS